MKPDIIPASAEPKSGLPTPLGPSEYKNAPTEEMLHGLYEKFDTKYRQRVYDSEVSKGNKPRPRDIKALLDKGFTAAVTSRLAPAMQWSNMETQTALSMLNMIGVNPVGISTQDIAEARSAAVLEQTKDIAQIDAAMRTGPITAPGTAAGPLYRQVVKWATAGHHILKDKLITDPLLTVPTTGVKVPNPFYNEDAALDKTYDEKQYWENIQLREAYGLPTYKPPGAKYLEAAGFNPLLAEIITLDLFDPLSYLAGKPLLALGGIATYKGINMMRKAHTARILLEGADLVREGKRVQAFAETMLAKPTAPQLGLDKDLVDVAVRHIGGALQESGETLTKGWLGQGGKIPRITRVLQRRTASAVYSANSVDVPLARMAKKMSPAERRALVELRLQMVTSSDELAMVQRTFSKHVDEFPADWFNKDVINHRYWDPVTSQIVELPGGLVREFYRRPDKFLKKSKDKSGATVYRLRADKEGEALRKAIGLPVKEGTAGVLNQIQRLKYMGNSPELARVTRALEEATVAQGGADAMTAFGSWAGGLGKTFRLPKHLLANTPFYGPLLNADNARQLAVQGRMFQFLGALGGKAWKYDNDLVSIVRGGRSGLAAKAIPTMTDDTHDALMLLVGGKGFKNEVNAARAADGLAPMTMERVAKLKAGNVENIAEIEKGLRNYFDDFALELVADGQLTMDQILKDYLPKIMRARRSGMDSAEIARSLERQILKTDSTKDYAFLSMLRKGELTQKNIRLADLVEAYTRAAYTQKYIQPVVRESMNILTDVKPNGQFRHAMAAGDRVVAANWLSRMAGGMSGDEVARIINTKEMQVVLDELPLTESVRASLTRAIDNAGGVANATNAAVQKASNLWYTGYMGARPGLAARNWFQQCLGLSHLGKGLPLTRRRPYLFAAYQEWSSNEVARQTFQAAAAKRGWTRAVGEFLDTEFKLKGQGIGTKVRDESMLWYMTADLNSRSKLYTGAGLYVDDLFTDMQKGGKAWERAVGSMTNSAERADFRAAMLNGDRALAKDLYGIYTVESTQWLYSAKNRPSWANKPVVGALYWFKSWPLNLAEETAAHWSRGLAMAGKTPGSTPIPRNFKQLKSAHAEVRDFLAPYMIMGGAVGTGGLVAGLDLFSWTWMEAPGPVKDLWNMTGAKATGLEMQDGKKYHMPIPAAWHDPLGPEGFAALRSARDVWRVGADIRDALIKSDPQDHAALTQSVWDSAFNSIPVIPNAVRGPAGEVLKALGVEPYAPLRNNFETILGATVGLPSPGTRAHSLGPVRFNLERLGFKTITDEENPLR